MANRVSKKDVRHMPLIFFLCNSYYGYNSVKDRNTFLFKQSTSKEREYKYLRTPSLFSVHVYLRQQRLKPVPVKIFGSPVCLLNSLVTVLSSVYYCAWNVVDDHWKK